MTFGLYMYDKAINIGLQTTGIWDAHPSEQTYRHTESTGNSCSLRLTAPQTV